VVFTDYEMILGKPTEAQWLQGKTGVRESGEKSKESKGRTLQRSTSLCPYRDRSGTEWARGGRLIGRVAFWCCFLAAAPVSSGFDAGMARKAPSSL